MRRIGRSVGETWRFFRLLAVGIAWGAPFSWLHQSHLPPGVRDYFHYGWLLQTRPFPMLLVAPVMGVIGIVLISWLSGPASRLSGASAVPGLLLVAACASVVLVFTGAQPFTSIGTGVFYATVILVALVAPAVGMVVSAVTLAQRTRWGALIWVSAWWLLGIPLFRQGAQISGDGVSGDLMISSLGMLFAVSLVASIGAYLAASVFAQERS